MNSLPFNMVGTQLSMSMSTVRVAMNPYKLASIALLGCLGATAANAGNAQEVKTGSGFPSNVLHPMDCTKLPQASLESMEKKSDGGSWKVSKEIDASNRTSSVTFSLTADQSDFGGCSIKRPLLAVVCDGKMSKTSIKTWLSNGPPNGPDGGVVMVSLKIGSTINRYSLYALFSDRYMFGKKAELMNKMLVHDSLTFEYRGFNSAWYTSTFDLHGLRDALKPYDEYCR